MSSLTQSNDSMEGRVAADLIVKLAREKQVSEERVRTLESFVRSTESIIDAYGFCLSEDGDLLSQWRGYADNAAGVSIGFNSDGFLKNLAMASGGMQSIHMVLYDEKSQRESLSAFFDRILKTIENGSCDSPYSLGKGLLGNVKFESESEIATKKKNREKATSELFAIFSEMIGHSYSLKLDAFKEEREWRIIIPYATQSDENQNHRVSQGRIIPYFDFEFHEDTVDVIEEVILGPKNPTPEHVVLNLLHLHGFTKARVRKSNAASYR